MANVLRVTLGPHARAVVMAPIISSRAPKLLTKLGHHRPAHHRAPQSLRQYGAMLIRHMAWRMREKVGSRPATAAVIAQALLHEANYQAHGGQRDDAQAGHRAGRGRLQRAEAVGPPHGLPEQIEAMAIATAADTEVGRYVAEMLEIIGTDGVILIEDHAGRKTGASTSRACSGTSYVSAYFCTDLDRMEAVVEIRRRQHGRQRGDGGAGVAHPGAGDGQEGGAGIGASS